MNKLLKPAVCLFFALLILCSCANVVPDTAEEPEKSYASPAEEVLDSLPDYGSFGDTVKIATSEISLFSDYDSGATAITSAVALRNDLIYRKYGAQIRTVRYNESEIYEKTYTAFLADNALADLYCFSMNTTVEMMLGDMLADLRVQSGFDIDAEFVDSETAKRSLLGSKLCFVTSPSALLAEKSYCVFYNKSFIQGLDDPATLYLRGEWTWEAFLRYSKAASAFCECGYLAEEGSEPLYAVWTATGSKMFASDGSLAEISSQPSAVTETVRSVYTSEQCKLTDISSAVASFNEGKSAFLMCKLENISEIASSETDFGIVPMPSYNTTASYGYVSGDALCFSVPAKADDAEGSVILLNAMLACGGESFTSALLDEYIAAYSVNNSQTVMIKKVIESAYVSPQFIYCAISGSKVFDAYVANVTNNS